MTRVLNALRKEPVSGDTRSIVVFLHGYGANGADLLGLADPLGEHLPDTLFIAPDAPEHCAGSPMGYQWFPIPWIDGSSEEESRRGMLSAVDDLNAFLDAVMVDEDVLPEQVVLFGFSQGTMMSLHVAPRRDDPVAGVVAFSGRLLEPDLLEDEVTSRMPILLVHGDQDDAGDQSVGGNGGSGVVILRYLANTPPSANAGPDADAFAGVQTSLDGSGSSDAENNITTYAWAQTGGTAVTLSDASAVAPSFTPGQPSSGTSDTLTFTLTVTDAFGRVRSDSVQITLNAMPELSASKTASIFSEDGTDCAALAATPPAEPATPVAVPGACIQYTIEVQNTGPVAATAVELTDTLPAQLDYVTAGLAGWQAGSLAVAGNTLTLTGGEVGAGQTASITIRARVR